MLGQLERDISLSFVGKDKCLTSLCYLAELQKAQEYKNDMYYIKMSQCKKDIPTYLYLYSTQ